MSGSPIYLNDKMIGAYAYGWSFGSEPVAGVTPIANMLGELARPLPSQIDGWPLKLLPQASNGCRLAGPRTPRHETTFRPALSGRPSPTTTCVCMRPNWPARWHGKLARRERADPVSTPILLGGMGPRSVALAQQMLAPLGLEPLQAGGGGTAEASAPTRFVDGGAIGVQLIRGDMSAMGSAPSPGRGRQIAPSATQ